MSSLERELSGSSYTSNDLQVKDFSMGRMRTSGLNPIWTLDMRVIRESLPILGKLIYVTITHLDIVYTTF